VSEITVFPIASEKDALKCLRDLTVGYCAVLFMIISIAFLPYLILPEIPPLWPYIALIFISIFIYGVFNGINEHRKWKMRYVLELKIENDRIIWRGIDGYNNIKYDKLRHLRVDIYTTNGYIIKYGLSIMDFLKNGLNYVCSNEKFKKSSMEIAFVKYHPWKPREVLLLVDPSKISESQFAELLDMWYKKYNEYLEKYGYDEGSYIDKNKVRAIFSFMVILFILTTLITCIMIYIEFILEPSVPMYSIVLILGISSGISSILIGTLSYNIYSFLKIYGMRVGEVFSDRLRYISHIIILILIDIFSILFSIYMILYSQNIMLIIIDLIATFLILTASIIQIPRLYKKLKGEGSKNEVVHQ